MKILVVGASGKVGRRVIHEAVTRRGPHDRHLPFSDVDYAKGMIDVIENGRYLRQRITPVQGDAASSRLDRAR